MSIPPLRGLRALRVRLPIRYIVKAYTKRILWIDRFRQFFNWLKSLFGGEKQGGKKEGEGVELRSMEEGGVRREEEQEEEQGGEQEGEGEGEGEERLALVESLD
jgi:hypothetical protein